MRVRVRSLALFSGLRMPRCSELWCRLQMRRGSRFAGAVAWALSLGTSLCHRCGPKEQNIYTYICTCIYIYIFLLLEKKREGGDEENFRKPNKVPEARIPDKQNTQQWFLSIVLAHGRPGGRPAALTWKCLTLNVLNLTRDKEQNLNYNLIDLWIQSRWMLPLGFRLASFYN